jgi:hypothetical protein
MIESEKKFDIEGVGAFCQIKAPFCEGFKRAKELGAQLPQTYRQIMEARFAAPDDSLIHEMTAIQEAFVYPAEGPCYIIRKSPLLDLQLAEKACPIHAEMEKIEGTPEIKTGKCELYYGEFFPAEDYEQILKQAEADSAKPPAEREVLAVPQRQWFAMAPDDIPSAPVYQFLLQEPKLLQQLADYLKARDIKEIHVWIHDWHNPDPARKPFLRHAFACGINTEFSINGGRKLGFDDGNMGKLCVRI